MLSKLNTPFPCIYGQKQNLITAILVSLFVGLFLSIFQPFGISESTDEYQVFKTAGFGLVSFIVLMFFYFGLPHIFKSFFEEKNYTLAKDLVMSAFLILCIGIANAVYAQNLLDQQAYSSLFLMIWQTFLVGIFPLTFLSLLQFNRLTNQNVATSDAINANGFDHNSKQLKDQSKQYYLVSGEQQTNEVLHDNLIYFESDGNYAKLISAKDDGLNKTIFRTTLKSLEQNNDDSNIIRCHRSFIVNLEKVKEVKGNAQGLKLILEGCDDQVPVSRKYIPQVRAYFEQQK